MKSITLFVLLSFLYGCGARKGKIEEKISDIIKENKDSGSCTIALKSITDFNWDTVYFIENSNDVSSIIKKDYPDNFSDEEFGASVIFLYKGKIVYHESEERDIESLVSGEVIVDDHLIDTCGYDIFVPSNAIFKESIKNEGEKYYYQLIPIGRK